MLEHNIQEVRETDDGRWPEDQREGTTHYPGCWQDRRHHNCAVALVRALVAADKERRDWQPIETAPKDGTEILLMHWRGAYEDSTVDVGSFEFLETSDFDGMRVYDWQSNYGYVSEEPTHWITLPSAPERK